MILTKNKSKNKKVKVDYDDEEHYMNFLRFKHLIDRRNRIENRTNRGTQTEIETNNDKATNTIDEVLEPFRLKMRSENFEDNQKATQTNAMRDQETEPRVRVTDDAYTLKGSERLFKSKLQQRKDMMLQVYMTPLRDTSPDTDDDDDKPSNALKALGLGIGLGTGGLYATYQGLRFGANITQMLLEGAINLYDAMQMQQEEDASVEDSRSSRDEEGEGNQTEVIEVEDSPPISVNTSPSITVDSSDPPTPTELPMPTSPSPSPRRNSRSSNESVGYPKKK